MATKKRQEDVLERMAALKAKHPDKRVPELLKLAKVTKSQYYYASRNAPKASKAPRTKTKGRKYEVIAGVPATGNDRLAVVFGSADQIRELVGGLQ